MKTIHYINSRITLLLVMLAAFFVVPMTASASEADLKLPENRGIVFHFPGIDLSSNAILWIGFAVCLGGMLFGVYLNIFI